MRIQSFFASVIILTAFIVPAFVFGQNQGGGGIVPTSCDGPDCQFSHLLELGTRIMDYLILVSIPLAAIAFAYAGYLMLTAGGNEGKVSDAREIFTKVMIGFVFVLCAWIIVRAITSALLDPNEYYNLLDDSRPNASP